MKGRESERGAALIIVIFASTLILLLLMSALTITLTSNRTLARQLSSQGQAVSAASAGLTEGLSWFVRQRQQPVTQFDPVVDAGGVCKHVPAHVPPVFDSEDPAAGIIRSFEITPGGKVWGRYELLRYDFSIKKGVKDVSTTRGKTQPGTIWQVESEGIVYVRNDPAKQPNVSPNFVLSRRRMRVDIQRLALLLPSEKAAMCAVRGDNINIIKPSRIQGGSGIGAAYPKNTGDWKGSGTVDGQPITAPPTHPFGISDIFGVTTGELIAMADVVADNESQLPNPLPDMSLVVVRGNATFNSVRPLKGSGILIVLGNLVLNPQSNAFYSGVIWVGGTFVATPPGTINGSVVANGNVQIAGGSDVVEINYDGAIIKQIRLQMGSYLFSRSPWMVTEAVTK